MLAVVALLAPAGAQAEQASEPLSAPAGRLDAGALHTCALDAGQVRCWGAGNAGQLGYGNADSIGDNELPGLAGPVDLGPGRTATAISAGDFHTCALLDNGSVRCWGFGGDGRLGYGNEQNVGDDESVASVAPVNVGTGRTAVAISAGGAHTCAVLDDGSVLCWGFGEDGRLGYGDTDQEGNEASIGDNEPPGSVAPVQIGAGRTATAISAGAQHTCVLLDDQNVRCWGTNGSLFGGDGRLGYGNANTIGDNETPATVDPLSLGAGATAISAGDFHTCAVLVGGSVRCWGLGVDGRLGYGNEFRIGDNETPDTVGPVDLGGPAVAISAGNHTCARLASGVVRCWGPGSFGRLGYANTNDIGDDETPGSAGPVALGGSAVAISAGGTHTCAGLADATLRCWGAGGFGRLGQGAEHDIGDDETPEAAGAIDLSIRGVAIDDAVVVEGDSGETALTLTVALSAPRGETSAVSYATVDDSAQAPSDYAARSGRLIFAPGETRKAVTVPVVGDVAEEADERFFVNLSSPTGLSITDAWGTATIRNDDVAPAVQAPPALVAETVQDVFGAQAQRRADLRRCRASAASKLRAARASARRRYRRPRVRARVLRIAAKTAAKRRAQCLKRFGRMPGRVTSLSARSTSRSAIVLRFAAPGTDGSKPPAAQNYVVKQSRRPIRTARDFDRALALCSGTCRFDVTAVGSEIALTVNNLRPRTTHYYAIAARDNVSARRGPRSKAVSARTR